MSCRSRRQEIPRVARRVKPAKSAPLRRPSPGSPRWRWRGAWSLCCGAAGLLAPFAIPYLHQNNDLLDGVPSGLKWPVVVFVALAPPSAAILVGLATVLESKWGRLPMGRWTAGAVAGGMITGLLGVAMASALIWLYTRAWG